MFIQSLKLQLKTCPFPFLLSFVISLAIAFLIRLISNKIEYYVMLFIVEFVYTFLYGLLNFSILGKTYHSLKHDKHNFCLSSLFINILNALIMTAIFTFITFLLNKSISAFSLITYASIHLLVFSLGGFFSLFLLKHKIFDIIALVIMFTIILLCSKYILSFINSFFNDLFNEGFNNFTLITLIINTLIIIALNVLNIIKYKKD